jgi:hypothetical protein
MIVDDLFDFEGRDVFTASPDAVLDAIDEEKPTFRIEPSGVTGMEPKVPPSCAPAFENNLA